MTHAQLVADVSDRCGCSKATARNVINTMVASITEHVAAGHTVAVNGLARFKVHNRPARMGRNPATGETIKIKAKRVPKATLAKAFKDAV